MHLLLATNQNYLDKDWGGNLVIHHQQQGTFQREVPLPKDCMQANRPWNQTQTAHTFNFLRYLTGPLQLLKEICWTWKQFLLENPKPGLGLEVWKLSKREGDDAGEKPMMVATFSESHVKSPAQQIVCILFTTHKAPESKLSIYGSEQANSQQYNVAIFNIDKIVNYYNYPLTQHDFWSGVGLGAFNTFHVGR